MIPSNGSSESPLGLPIRMDLDERIGLGFDDRLFDKLYATLGRKLYTRLSERLGQRLERALFDGHYLSQDSELHRVLRSGFTEREDR